jgi:hypothetical protein
MPTFQVDIERVDRRVYTFKVQAGDMTQAIWNAKEAAHSMETEGTLWYAVPHNVEFFVAHTPEEVK